MIDWEELPSAPVVPYPDLFDDVLHGRAYWTITDIIDYLDFGNAGGVRYVRDYEIPSECGEGAWRRHDPAHPRCWYCGKFVSPKAARYYTVGCPDCGEWLGGPW